MKTIKILLANHHETTRSEISRFLKKQKGVESVVEVRNGPEAIDTTSRYTPDLVLVEMNTPGENGFTVTKQIKQKVPSAHVFLLTFHDPTPFRLMAEECAADGVIETGKMKRTLETLVRNERIRVSAENHT